jgi:hypothetical protein
LRRENPDVDPRLILSSSQKLLDRILFIAFCEDRGLLPAESIKRAYAHRDPYNPRPLWDNFRGMFRAVNTGNRDLNIHKYNGGLFADDPILDNLKIPDDVFGMFRDVGEYNFRPASEIADVETVSDSRFIDVEILGHIFEQSIDDLEKLQTELDKPAEIPVSRPDAETRTKVSRRKREGAFYTPAYITRYIVEQALGGVLRDRFESLRRVHAERAKGTARSVMAEPTAYNLDSLNAPQKQALLSLWLDWQHELGTIRVLDPACGSGAFLIQAFDHLHAEYERTNDRVRELRGHAELFDLDRKILQDNLYGVDLNVEAVHVARLSLWIKTAVAGKILTSLDHTIKVGNSIVADAGIDQRAFDWLGEFPEVFKPESGDGGFDVVIGNPPYIRQEWLSPIKPYLQSRYSSFHGMADIYVYFYEIGLNLLKPGGRLSYVVTNKWMKAGYGEPLRKFFAEKGWVESVVDFGHAKHIFLYADVFHSIIVIRKPNEGPTPKIARVCLIPRDQLRVDDLSVQIRKEGLGIDRVRLGGGPWSLEPGTVEKLLEKLQRSGSPLQESFGIKPRSGFSTGLNDAFVIDSQVRDRLVEEDPNCEAILKPYLRGQDIDRWTSHWAGYWLIFTRKGVDIDAYPSVKHYLEGFRERLEPKPTKWQGDGWRGRKPGQYKWFEIQDTVDYWELFESPKIIYPDITWRPSFSLDNTRYYGSKTLYFLTTSDLWVLGVLNSPIAWWYAWRKTLHGKDEALRYHTPFMEAFPLPEPTDGQRTTAELVIRRTIQISATQHEVIRDLLDWLRVEHEIAEPSTKLRSLLELDNESFVVEVRRAKGKKNPLSLAALRSLREEHSRTILPAQALSNEAMGLEREMSNLVNQAYGLTPEEVELMWETAPPRMPIPNPFA